MIDNAQMPRLREQYKDNAVEVDRNAQEKIRLRNKKPELEECFAGNPNGTCGCGCGCVDV